MNESLMAPRSKYKHGLISKVTSPLVYGAVLWAGGRLRMIWSVSPFALELDFALSLSLSGDLHHLLALTIDLSGLGLEELEKNPLVFQCVHMQ